MNGNKSTIIATQLYNLLLPDIQPNLNAAACTKQQLLYIGRVREAARGLHEDGKFCSHSAYQAQTASIGLLGCGPAESLLLIGFNLCRAFRHRTEDRI